MARFISEIRRCSRTSSTDMQADGSVWIKLPTKNNKFYQSQHWKKSQAPNSKSKGLCIYLSSQKDYKWSNVECKCLRGVICKSRNVMGKHEESVVENTIDPDHCLGKTITHRYTRDLIRQYLLNFILIKFLKAVLGSMLPTKPKSGELLEEDWSFQHL